MTQNSPQPVASVHLTPPSPGAPWAPTVCPDGKGAVSSLRELEVQGEGDKFMGVFSVNSWALTGDLGES